MEYKNQQFICPMSCEGTKCYDQPGDCPVCNMHLKSVNDNDPGHHHQ
jgi:Cu2+-exporting ATPase